MYLFILSFFHSSIHILNHSETQVQPPVILICRQRKIVSIWRATQTRSTLCGCPSVRSTTRPFMTCWRACQMVRWREQPSVSRKTWRATLLSKVRLMARCVRLCYMWDMPCLIWHDASKNKNKTPFYSESFYWWPFCILYFLTDLKWIQVNNAEEAYRVLKIGRKNQSFSSTRLNNVSSRRCYFRLMTTQPVA